MLFIKEVLEPEIWDLYDRYGKKTGETLLRGMPIPEDRYHFSVSVWILNSNGQYLLSQRHPDKQYPLRWECSGGCVLSGEDSLQGAIREVKEELGISLEPAGAKLLSHTRRDETQDFYDVWQFHADVDLSEIRMQETEIVAVKLVNREELLAMYDSEELHPLLKIS